VIQQCGLIANTLLSPDRTDHQLGRNLVSPIRGTPKPHATLRQLRYRVCMLHLLKQSAAIAAIGACALFIVLWIRSQVWQDTIYYVPSHMSRVHRVDTMVGRMIISFGAWTSPVFEPGLLVSGEHRDPRHEGTDFMRGFFGLAFMRSAGGSLLASLPYWFLTSLTAAVALPLNATHLRRFGLRHLFVAFTLVATTLGLGLFATKSTTQFLWLIW